MVLHDKNGIANGGTNLVSGSYKVGGTAVIDSSRNLVNIDKIYLDGAATSGVTYLTNSSSDGTGYVQVQTQYGYTRIGAGNATYSHFYTDRGRYYFNKRIQVDEGIVQSHNEDTAKKNKQ